MKAGRRTIEHDRHRRIRDLQAHLADDRFNLVVVGRFSRGKTSLMNAVLGNAWLPTGIVPLTSVITTVTYGSKEQVVLKYQDRGTEIADRVAGIARLHYAGRQPWKHKEDQDCSLRRRIHRLRLYFCW